MGWSLVTRQIGARVDFSHLLFVEIHSPVVERSTRQLGHIFLSKRGLEEDEASQNDRNQKVHLEEILAGLVAEVLLRSLGTERFNQWRSMLRSHFETRVAQKRELMRFVGNFLIFSSLGDFFRSSAAAKQHKTELSLLISLSYLLLLPLARLKWASHAHDGSQLHATR